MAVDENGNIIPQADNEDSTTSKVVTEGDPSVNPETHEEPGTSIEANENIEDDSTLTEDEKKRLPRAVRERIAERKKRQAAENEAAYWKGIAEANKSRTADPGTAGQGHPGATGEPKPENFDTWEAYQSAKINYEINKRVDEKVSAAVIARTFDQKIGETAKTKPDVLRAIQDPSFIVSSSVAQLIRESENPGDLILHLYANPTERYRISQLPLSQAAKEIGKIEARLDTPPTMKTRTISQAPEPTRPLAGKGTLSVDEDSISDDEWIRRRNQEVHGK